MTRRKTLIIWLLLCCATAPRSVRAAEPAKQALINLELAWSGAVSRHDVAAVGKILDDDYVGIDGRGVITHKADELAEAAPPDKAAAPPTFQILEENLSDFQVRLFEKVAIVNALNTVKATVRGEPRTVRYRRTTVWRRSGSSWKLSLIHI